MDRFYYTVYALRTGEIVKRQLKSIKIYDGENKSQYESGCLTVTSHRLIWQNGTYMDQVLALDLNLVKTVLEERPSGFSLKGNYKVIIHLLPREDRTLPGPTSTSFSFIKLGMKVPASQIVGDITLAVHQAAWKTTHAAEIPIKQTNVTQSYRVGIMGIERKLDHQRLEADKDISSAFQDLTQLMGKAKEMVALSSSINKKISEKQGFTNDDQTIQFKSYLLSMGIDNPVTRGSHGTGIAYHAELAREINSLLHKPITETGGSMSLTDVYLYVNRARGVHLLSPDDLLNACLMLESLQLPLVLRTFESGVRVLQLSSHSDAEVVGDTKQLVVSNGCLTPEQLSAMIGVTIILAKERLLLAENLGAVCRDVTVEGLKFYPNRFTDV